MDLSVGAKSISEQEKQSSDKGKTACCHNPEITSRLEKIFTEMDLPTEHQMHEIGRELGLDPKQVKYWFQYKRNQKKIQNENANNATLDVENERLLMENMSIEEKLKIMFCPSCNGPSQTNHEENGHSMEQLHLENEDPKLELERMSKSLSRSMLEQNKSEEQPRQMQLTHSTTSSQEDHVSLKPTSKMTEMEKAIMLEAIMAAKEELRKLLYVNEPLWVKSQFDHRLVLGELYDKFFPRVNHFNGSKARVESSKDSRIVRINAAQLVDMLLDSEKWNNLFSTVVTKAQTIEVLEKGSPENRNGAMLLMYEEMHVLSHLLPYREFYIIRHCEQIEVGTWIIVDLSYNYLKEKEGRSSTWKCPSGCMIRQISRASSQVFWVEHVEIEDNIQTHYLYRDIVNSTIAFGADRWLTELQRMGERFASAASEYIPTYESGVVNSSERKKVFELSHQMVKGFCNIFTMSNGLKFSQFSTEDDNNMDMITVRKSIDSFTIERTIIAIARSFSLPFPSHILFEFFRDPQNRIQWDTLSFGNPLYEVAHLSCGVNSNISIIQPLNPPPSNGMVIIQESFINPLGAFVVYSSVTIHELMIAINGQDSSTLPLLPSGIVISEDCNRSGNKCNNSTKGSLLTMTFQIWTGNEEEVNMESVAAAKSLMTSTIQRIKSAFLWV